MIWFLFLLGLIKRSYFSSVLIETPGPFGEFTSTFSGSDLTVWRKSTSILGVGVDLTGCCVNAF